MFGCSKYHESHHVCWIGGGVCDGDMKTHRFSGVWYLLKAQYRRHLLDVFPPSLGDWRVERHPPRRRPPTRFWKALFLIHFLKEQQMLNNIYMFKFRYHLRQRANAINSSSEIQKLQMISWERISSWDHVGKLISGVQWVCKINAYTTSAIVVGILLFNIIQKFTKQFAIIIGSKDPLTIVKLDLDFLETYFWSKNALRRQCQQQPNFPFNAVCFCYPGGRSSHPIGA